MKGFDRADYDKEKEAREMAAKVGAEFCPIPIRQDDLADHFLTPFCNRKLSASMRMAWRSTF
jgi:hypothetical protein